MAVAFQMPKFGGNPRDGFKLELKGLSDLTKKLEGRVRRMEQSILRKACIAFGEPIRADMERRARAQVSPRVVIRTDVRIRGSFANVKIGPIGEFFYLFFFEYGYYIRATVKGPKLKYIGPKATARPAYDAHWREGMKAFEEIMYDGFSQDTA